MKIKVFLVDTTLRDGEQAAGVVFRRQDRINLLRAIDTAGVDEIEVGIPAVGPEEVAFLRHLGRLGFHARLSVWCRARTEDLEAAARTGLTAVNLAVPVGSAACRATKTTWSQWQDRLPGLIRIAKSFALHVSVGAVDASRANCSRLKELALITQSSGAYRLRLADSAGIWSPAKVAVVMRSLRRFAPDLTLGIHAHNDYGLAVANTLAAIRAGCISADVTVCGLGERAGNAALEQVVMALERFGPAATSVQNNQLYGLAQLVSEIIGRPIPPGAPIVGRYVASHGSGIHSASAKVFQAFSPETVGHPVPEILTGRLCGSTAIIQAMDHVGVNLDRTQARRLLPQVRQATEEAGRSLSPQELLHIIMPSDRHTLSSISHHV